MSTDMLYGSCIVAASIVVNSNQLGLCSDTMMGSNIDRDVLFPLINNRYIIIVEKRIQFYNKREL